MARRAGKAKHRRKRRARQRQRLRGERVLAALAGQAQAVSDPLGAFNRLARPITCPLRPLILTPQQAAQLRGDPDFAGVFGFSVASGCWSC